MIPPCLTLSNIRSVSRVKWSNQGVVAIEKGAFWSPSTMVANFTFTYFQVNAFHSSGKILVCAYTIYLYCQIKIFCTIPGGSPYPHSLVLRSFCSSFLCWLMWLMIWFYHHITYNCYSVVFYLFSLLQNWFSWRCFVLPSEEIQFLSLRFFSFLSHV